MSNEYLRKEYFHASNSTKSPKRAAPYRKRDKQEPEPKDIYSRPMTSEDMVRWKRLCLNLGFVLIDGMEDTSVINGSTTSLTDESSASVLLEGQETIVINSDEDSNTTNPVTIPEATPTYDFSLPTVSPYTGPIEPLFGVRDFFAEPNQTPPTTMDTSILDLALPTEYTRHTSTDDHSFLGTDVSFVAGPLIDDSNEYELTYPSTRGMSIFV
jgi:hypothetical protein